MKPGDKVIVNDFYLAHYPMWDVKGKIAKVLKVINRTLPAVSLTSSEDRALYRHKYGLQEIYPLVSAFILFEDGTYLVSELGIDIVK